jgi:hypothetical protein
MLVGLYTVRIVLSILGVEDYGIDNIVAGVVTHKGGNPSTYRVIYDHIVWTKVAHFIYTIEIYTNFKELTGWVLNMRRPLRGELKTCGSLRFLTR